MYTTTAAADAAVAAAESIHTSAFNCMMIACKNGGWWRWALLSLDGVAPIRMVGVSASVNLPLHHKVQKFSYGTGSPGWSQKKGRKTVVVWWCGS